MDWRSRTPCARLPSAGPVHSAKGRDDVDVVANVCSCFCETERLTAHHRCDSFARPSELPFRRSWRCAPTESEPCVRDMHFWPAKRPRRGVYSIAQWSDQIISVGGDGKEVPSTHRAHYFAGLVNHGDRFA
jgi:hypothetical protein